MMSDSSRQQSDVSDSDELLKPTRNQSLEIQQVKKTLQIVQKNQQRENYFDDIFDTIQLKKIIINSIGDLLVVIGLLATKIYSKLLPLKSRTSYKCKQLISFCDHSQNLDEEYYKRFVKAHRSSQKTEDKFQVDIVGETRTSSVLINQLIRVCFNSRNICLINLNQKKKVDLWVGNNIELLSKVLIQYKISVLKLDPKRLILALEDKQRVNHPKKIKIYQSQNLELFSSNSTSVQNIKRQIVFLDKKCSFNTEEIFQYIWKEEARNKEIKQGRLLNIIKLFQQKYEVASQIYLSIHEQNNKYQFNSHLKLAFITEKSFIQFIKNGINLQVGSCFRFKQKLKAQKIVNIDKIEFKSKQFAEEPSLKDTFIQQIFKKIKNQQSLKSDVKSSKYENSSSKKFWNSEQKPKSQLLHFGIYSLKTIELIGQNIFQRDIFYLKNIWNSGFSTYLCHIYQNWSKYSFQYEKTIKSFIKILQYKVGENSLALKQISLYEYVYPQINQLIKLFRQKLKLNSIFLERDQFIKNYKYNTKLSEQQIIVLFIQQHLNIDQVYESLNDKLLAYYLNQKQRKKNKMGISYIKLKQMKKHSQNHQKPQNPPNPPNPQNNNTPKKGNEDKDHAVNTKRDHIQLSEYIYHFGFYQNGMNRYQDLLNQINQKYSIDLPQKTKDQKKKQQMFLKNIAFERVVDIRCLGCAPFFYYRTNIIDDNSNQILVRTFEKAEKMKESEAAIKDEMCMMLNNGGGIILFDCLREYRNIEPVGQIITEIKKDQYQQRIYSYLSCFCPKIEIKTNVQVTFVPLLTNPLRQLSNKNLLYYTGDEAYQKKNQPYFQRNYVKGLYVTRIRIVPEPTKVYFWISNIDDTKDKDIPLYCSIQKSGHRAQIKSLEMIRLLKKRFKSFYIPEYIDPVARKFLKKPSNCFNHQCLKPEAGLPTANASEKKQEIKKLSINQKSFDYVSMLIAKKSDHEAIQDFINGKKKEKDCKIEIMFRKYKFNVAINTAILFHQKKFEEVLNIINNFNKKCQKNRKIVLLISVTNYVLLKERNINNKFSFNDFTNLFNWLKSEFSQQKIQLWEFTAQTYTKQYYIKTETRISTVFIYYILNHFTQKAVFKNPYHLDKLSDDQFKQRMKLVYEMKQNPGHQSDPIEPPKIISIQQYIKYMDSKIYTKDLYLDNSDSQEIQKSFSNHSNSINSSIRFT